MHRGRVCTGSVHNQRGKALGALVYLHEAPVVFVAWQRSQSVPGADSTALQAWRAFSTRAPSVVTFWALTRGHTRLWRLHHLLSAALTAPALPASTELTRAGRNLHLQRDLSLCKESGTRSPEAFLLPKL